MPANTMKLNRGALWSINGLFHVSDARRVPTGNT
jgi:hypothetical protein